MFDIEEFCEHIKRVSGVDYALKDARELSTYRGGGSAYAFSPQSEGEFEDVYIAMREEGANPFVLGGGSNTIIADGTVSTPVILTVKLCDVHKSDGGVYAECGAKVAKASRALRENQMSGLDFLSGVPLSVGGAVRMNAAAFSRQTADYVKSVRVLVENERTPAKTPTYEVITLRREEINFGYRRGVEGIILGAELSGEETDKKMSVLAAESYAKERAKRQPRLPSLGSVFKNGETPSGKLIEECGLKGLKTGGAKVSEIHANFIVNVGGGTASDFVALAEECKRRVLERFGVELECEVKYLI